MANTLLTFGHGYVAQHLARALQDDGWRVTGTTRDAGRAQAMRDAGVTPLPWPGDIGAALAQATHLLVSAPPDAAGDPLLRVLPETGPGLRWIGYLSTTGVYGDHAGAVVDEDSETLGQGRRNLARIAAEAGWRARGAEVFRLSGIYGPGRGPLARLRAGTARRIVKPGHLFGRIHVADIVQVLRAAMARPVPGRILNVTDDLPAPGDEVVAHAASLLGIEPPPAERFEDAAMSALASSFYQGRRVVANRRMKEELGVRLLYPDYRAGLAAVLRDEGGG